MKRVFLSAVLAVAPVAAFAGGGGAAAPPDGMRDTILHAIHVIGHALGLI
jgi:hypothetical protein